VNVIAIVGRSDASRRGYVHHGGSDKGFGAARRTVGSTREAPSLSETTAIDATVVADAETSIDVWGAEPDEPEEQVIQMDCLPSGGRSLLAVTALAAVAMAIGTVAAVVVLAPAMRAGHYAIGQSLVEQAPASLAKAVSAPPKAPPPGAVLSVQRGPVRLLPVKAAPLAMPSDANQRFVASVVRGGMWRQSGPYDEEQAGNLCQDLANGRSLSPYIEGAQEENPQLTPQEAEQVVYEAIESYCPQYAHRSRGKR
jgi:hypothetical protein